jgi:hypothetical protein
VKTIVNLRVTEAAARYSEQAPVAAACCNACRTCLTTNAVALVTGGLVAAAGAVRRLATGSTRAKS